MNSAPPQERLRRRPPSGPAHVALLSCTLGFVSVGCLHQMVDPSAAHPGAGAGDAGGLDDGASWAGARDVPPGTAPEAAPPDAGSPAPGTAESSGRGDAGPEPPAPAADAGEGALGPTDAGTDAAPAGDCALWSDCGPFFGDPNSGYACVAQQCVCDPGGSARQRCAADQGLFQEALCYCQPGEGVAPGPDEGCTDPGSCEATPGDEGVDPPPDDPEEDCVWTWVEPLCDPDRWVDTSHYEQRCGYNARDEYVCESVWVESGYWERGDCPPGYWDERC